MFLCYYIHDALRKRPSNITQDGSEMIGGEKVWEMYLKAAENLDLV